VNNGTAMPFPWGLEWHMLMFFLRNWIFEILTTVYGRRFFFPKAVGEPVEPVGEPVEPYI
jgi:hypothetical protein